MASDLDRIAAFGRAGLILYTVAYTPPASYAQPLPCPAYIPLFASVRPEPWLSAIKRTVRGKVRGRGRVSVRVRGS